MNLVTGHRLFLVRERQYTDDFQVFLHEVRRHYRGWHVVLLLDGDRSHTAAASRNLAHRLHIRLLWLPKRSPELNPMDTLWGQAKDAVCVNTQYVDIDEQADAFIAHVSGLSNREALQTSGVLSVHFWLNLKTVVERWYESRKESIGAAFRRFHAIAEQFLLGYSGSAYIVF